jgi:phosphatidate phosphatase APP1
MIIRRIFQFIDGFLDVLWKTWRAVRGPLRQAQLVPYRSYGTAGQLIVRGRVLTNRPLRPSQTDSAWRNAWHMFQRWATREIPGVVVTATWAGNEASAITDDEGYFRIEIGTQGRLDRSTFWQDVSVRLPAFPQTAPVTAKVVVPNPAAQFGVISDIDDTVIFSSATNYVRMAKIVLLGTAYSRLPFKGVAAFYRGLEKGTHAQPVNPIFYVSSSPWNLYDVLRDLFEFRSLPAGPLLLQDFGIDAEKFLHHAHRVHKVSVIRDLLDRYPHLPFLLIGDSGQQDPEIYREILRLYPGRVLSIYIRDVSRRRERNETVRKLAAEIDSPTCQLLLVKDTLAAAEHALRRGWIGPEVLEEIRMEKASEPPPQALEEALQQQT